jgi:hypothetical protein
LLRSRNLWKLVRFHQIKSIYLVSESTTLSYPSL